MNTNEKVNLQSSQDIQAELFESLAQNFVDEIRLLKEMSIPFINWDDFEPESTFIFQIQAIRKEHIKKAENESIFLRGNMIRANFLTHEASEQFCEFILPQQFQTQLENLFGKEKEWIDKKIVCKYMGKQKALNYDTEYYAFVIKTAFKKLKK